MGCFTWAAGGPDAPVALVVDLRQGRGNPEDAPWQQDYLVMADVGRVILGWSVASLSVQPTAAPAGPSDDRFVLGLGVVGGSVRLLLGLA